MIGGRVGDKEGFSAPFRGHLQYRTSSNMLRLMDRVSLFVEEKKCEVVKFSDLSQFELFGLVHPNKLPFFNPNKPKPTLTISPAQHYTYSPAQFPSQIRPIPTSTQFQQPQPNSYIWLGSIHCAARLRSMTRLSVNVIVIIYLCTSELHKT